jgi:hypothetical protein
MAMGKLPLKVGLGQPSIYHLITPIKLIYPNKKFI